MSRCLFGGDPDHAFQPVFCRQAFSGLHTVRRFFIHRHVFPGEETVKLAVVFSPGAGFDHEIRRFLSGCPILGKLSEDRFVLPKIRIA